MHLVVNHMAEFDHIDHTYGCRLVKVVAGDSVTEFGLAVFWNACLVSVLADVLDAGTVENRGAELQAELCAGPAEYGLVDLAEVHS